ncbi:PIN domain-containing protein [Lysinibacillus odysseyi]|uniref:C2H2-type domain-containing protein n=1 Tax=Lysinibacillus odysseyi 34hs-1 = NBRC 100172 TaxID=1220589 RepID=A0A0A3IAH3_9BACI|nr:PIN domain-containing protein [Lysinibacillus odysseyi]KGR81761.1 hypothetical protein CD32_20720 [Lysinibacillus odysseyi 34hs-1 = NBRC 100172]
MHIFLDANILYKDPFLKTGYLSLLKRLAKDGRINLYISETSYKEVLHRFQSHYAKLITDAKFAAHHMNYLLKKDTVTIHVTEEELVQYFEENFYKNVEDGVIEMIEADERLINKVVELELSPLEPFYHAEIDEGGRPYFRKSVQEAITWYTYANFITDNELEDCYFISTNIEKFADSRPFSEMDAFLPHPNLAHHGIELCFKSVRGFLNYKPELLRFSLTSEVDEIYGDYLVQFANTNLNISMLDEMFECYLKKDIEYALMENLIKLTPASIHPDYQSPGRFVPKKIKGYQDVELQNIILFNECFLVSCHMNFEVDVDLYVHPVVHMDPQHPQLLYSSESVLADTYVSFFIPIELQLDEWHEKMKGIKDFAAISIEKQEEIWQYLLEQFKAFYHKIDLQNIEIHEVDIRQIQLKNQYVSG